MGKNGEIVLVVPLSNLQYRKDLLQEPLLPVNLHLQPEGDVFYVYVKRQFMSKMISADECLWKFC